MPEKKNDWPVYAAIFWGLIVIYLASAVLINVNVNFLLGMTIPGFVFALFHASKRYGWLGVLVFIAISFVVSFTIENVCIVSGYPFGTYHYTGNFPGPRIFLVPLIIGVTYFSSGYASWMVGNVLLGRPDLDPQSPYFKFALPVVAAFVMVLWDLCMDPINATIAGNWVWHHGGGYFGVPLSNFVGWFVTVWIFYQLFALYVAKRKAKVLPRPEKSYWYQPVAYYFVLAVTQVFMYALQRPGAFPAEVVDGAGKGWSTQGILEALSVVSIFGMIFISVLAFLKFKQDGKVEKS